MPENPTILDKQPAGWTLIVLLIVVAIIALLMALYLPSVLQMSGGKEGTRKPTLEQVEDQLAPIEPRRKAINEFIDQQIGRDQKQTQQDQQDQQDQEDDYEE